MNNKHQIIQGDCIAGMKTLPDGCIHTCVTSPPYFALRAYNGGEDEIGTEHTVEEYVQNLVDVFREVKRILRDDGTLWLNLGDSYMSQKGCSPPPQTLGGQRGMPTDGVVPGNRREQKGLKHKDLIGIPWRVAFALQTDGWWLRQDIIWSKPNPMPESVTDRCTKSHEYIFLLSKNSHYHFDHEVIREDAVGKIGKPPRVFGAKEQEGTMRGDIGNTFVDTGLRNKRSVWTVNTQGYKGAHFAVYPKALILPCILATCPEGGTVFDPFTGSGTTAVVALENDRNYIGTELNPEYIKIAEERIKNEIKPTLSEVFE